MKYIERTDYNNVITIKLVIPCGCNAKCPFCYNKDKRYFPYDKEQFLNNFIKSLDNVINLIGEKNPISVDITGGEPTLDPELLVKILLKLKEYNIQSKVLRVTLTSNGSNLKEIIPYMKNVVNYVNISIHDWHPARREKILGFSLYKLDYMKIIKRLNSIGITVSACAVIFKPIQNFSKWRDNFINWAKAAGFIAVRFRCDVFWNESNIFDNYLLESMNELHKFDTINYEKTTDSHWCRLRRKDGMRVFFLHGVLDTSIITKGIEYVIDTNGQCYCDYYRRTKINDYNYEVGKIYDAVME